MNPVEPTVTKPLALGWSRVCYAENQPQYIPLPALQGPSPHVPVVSEWELNDGDIALMSAMIKSHRADGPRPRIALTVWTFGGALQPIRLEVGQSRAALMLDDDSL